MCHHFRPVHFVHLCNCKRHSFNDVWCLVQLEIFLCFFLDNRVPVSHSKQENMVRSSGGRFQLEMCLACSAVTKCCKKLPFLKLLLTNTEQHFSPREDEWLPPHFLSFVRWLWSCCENRFISIWIVRYCCHPSARRTRFCSMCFFFSFGSRKCNKSAASESSQVFKVNCSQQEIFLFFIG